MKNLKMFAIGLAAMAAMTMGVHATSCADTADAMLNDVCKSDLNAALKDAKEGDTIKLLDNSDWSSSQNLKISKKVTIDLNGKTITVNDSTGLVVLKGAEVTLTGTGNVKNTSSASQSLIVVEAGSTLNVEGSVKLIHEGGNATAAILVKGNADESISTNVTVGNDVTVTSKNHGLVVGLLNDQTTALNTKVDIAGKWTTAAYVVKVNGNVAYNENAPKINVTGGTYTSTDATALYASGYAEWTVNGTVKGAQALEVRSGKVNVTGGSYTATGTNTKGTNDGNGTNAITIVGGTANYPDAEYIDVTISGGEFTAKEKNSYAIRVEGVDEDSKLAISGGKFTSGKDNDNKQLPVMSIDDPAEFMEDHKNIISGGEFIGGLTGEVTSGLTKYSSEEVLKELASAEFNTNENGTVVVGNPSTEPDPVDPGQTDPQDPNTGSGENPSEPPKTGDNIMAFVGLGIASLAVVGLGTKNLKKQTN